MNPCQGKTLDDTKMTANRSGAWNDLKADRRCEVRRQSRV